MQDLINELINELNKQGYKLSITEHYGPGIWKIEISRNNHHLTKLVTDYMLEYDKRFDNAEEAFWNYVNVTVEEFKRFEEKGEFKNESV